VYSVNFMTTVCKIIVGHHCVVM